jgi:GNAT superfamily N-acetyltransferase
MITWYLEMFSPDELRAKSCSDPNFVVRELCPKDFRINRSFYLSVGSDWEWKDRLSWTNHQWINYAEAEDLKTYIACDGKECAGYYELQVQPEDNVEIAYFGLVPEYIGRGFGGFLLSHAIKTAWSLTKRRVWVHTCTRDHPNALRNYEARGFKIYKIEEVQQHHAVSVKGDAKGGRC